MYKVAQSFPISSTIGFPDNKPSCKEIIIIMEYQETPRRSSTNAPSLQHNSPLSSGAPCGGRLNHQTGATPRQIRNPYTIRRRRKTTVDFEEISGTSSSSVRRRHVSHVRAERLFSQDKSTDTRPPGIMSLTEDDGSNQAVCSSQESFFMPSQTEVETSPRSVVERTTEEGQFLALPSGATNKFFAVLIQNSIQDLVDAAIDDENDDTGIMAAERLLCKMCERVNIPFPMERIKAKYDTAKDHMQSRAALVLEEARYTLCQDLYDLKLNDIKSAFAIEVEVKEEEDECHGEILRRPRLIDSPVFFKRTVYEDGWFTAKELNLLIPGLIVQCVSEDDMGEVLGVLALQNSPTDEARNGLLQVLFFNQSLSFPPKSRWTLHPVGTSHINTARQFEAVTEYETLVPFFEVVRGATVPGDQGLSQEGDATDSGARVEAGQLQMPILNESQQKAASTFLGSEDGTVAIVQGYVPALA